jgi:hypothetical protein
LTVHFSDDDARRMRELQLELTLVLRKANDQHLEAVLAAFACVRCARALLDLYNGPTRAELVKVIVAFLEHADAGDGGKLLVM